MPLEEMMRTNERDMRALWIVDLILEIWDVAKREGAWYRGENVAIPQIMLSSVTRPAGDADKRMTHRFMAFARAAKKGDRMESDAMQKLERVFVIAFDELQKVANLVALIEARQQLSELLAFMRESGSKSYSQAVFSEILMEKVKKFAALWQSISEAYASLERDLMGYAVEDPVLRRIESGIENIEEGVGRLIKREKSRPASAKVQHWVETTWGYYKTHPQACLGNVARRRVRMLDVWMTVNAQAAAYGINSLQDFCRIHDAARHAKSRR